MNLVNLLSLMMGILIGLFAIALSVYLSRESEKLIRAGYQITQASFEFSKTSLQYTESTLTNSESALRLSQELSISNLKNLFESSKDENSRRYWYFRWRFETWDSFSIIVRSENRVKLGDCQIDILGFSNPSNRTGLENRESDFYQVRISAISPSGGREFPFLESQKALCFVQEDKMIISKGPDPWTEEEKYCFEIMGLGRPQARTGEIDADNATIYPRIKDT